LGQKLIKNLTTIRKGQYEVLATSQGEDRVSKLNGYNYLSLDITNVEEIDSVFDNFKPDVVINTAAMTNVDVCEVEKQKCTQLNVDAVKYLIKASKKHSSHLIHLSTDFVFDGKDGPYKETDEPQPLSYYGQSKLDSERLLEKSEIKWSNVRTIIVYGVAEAMSRTNIVLWAKQALEKGDPLSIVNDQFRSPTLAEDLAEGCLLIADQGKEGTYHISGKDQMSIVELVKRVAAYFKLDATEINEVSSSTLNQAAKRPPKTGFILDKAITDLNYQPHSFEEGLEILEEQLKA
jgi:dTDP-4-dehydrorhamnose reductase